MGIDDARQIIANGSDGQACLLTETNTPEPGSWGLLGAGLIALVTLRRKHR